MKAFRFPLSRVLDWRRSEMELEENKLKQMHASLGELDRARAELESARSAAEQALVAQAVVEAQELHALDGWRWAVKVRCEEIARRRREQEAEIAAQQQKLMEARRRYRLLDKLRERRHAEWRYELEREEAELAASPRGRLNTRSRA